MVGHGVQTAQPCKRGKQNSCLSGKIQGKTVKVALYMWAKAECPRLFYTGALSFYIHSLYPGTGKNRD